MATRERLRILVAGAAGQVGEPLALELRRRGHDVYGLIRNPEKGKLLTKGEVKLVIGSVDDPKVIEPIFDKVDVIINASNSYGDLTLEEKTYNLISSAAKKSSGAKKKVIFLSGGLVYAGNPPGKPVTEESPTATNVPFLAPRLRVEQELIKSKDVDGTVARLPFVVGGERGHWTIYFEQAAAGKLKVYGDGSNIICYGHVDDLVNGIIAIAEAETKLVQGQIFNISEYHKDKPVSLKDAAVAYAKGAGYENVPIEYEPWDAHTSVFNVNVWMDTTKLEKTLGWKAHHNVMEESKLLYDAWKEFNVPAKWY